MASGVLTGDPPSRSLCKPLLDLLWRERPVVGQTCNHIEFEKLSAVRA